MITCGSGHPLSCPELEKKIVKFCILPILRFIYTLHTTCAKKNIIQATKESYTDYLTFSSSHVKKVKRFYMFSQKFYHTILLLIILCPTYSPSPRIIFLSGIWPQDCYLRGGDWQSGVENLKYKTSKW